MCVGSSKHPGPRHSPCRASGSLWVGQEEEVHRKQTPAKCMFSLHAWCTVGPQAWGQRVVGRAAPASVPSQHPTLHKSPAPAVPGPHPPQDAPVTQGDSPAAEGVWWQLPGTGPGTCSQPLGALRGQGGDGHPQDRGAMHILGRGRLIPGRQGGLTHEGGSQLLTELWGAGGPRVGRPGSMSDGEGSQTELKLERGPPVLRTDPLEHGHLTWVPGRGRTHSAAGWAHRWPCCSHTGRGHRFG